MALYHTHRPKQFADIIGQEAPVAILQQALIRSQPSHAYLFSGPRGTGKTSAARIFARAINCLKPISNQDLFEPCNSCPVCVDSLGNQALDIQEIDAASNRGIEDIRALREQVQYPPIQLKRKVYIIDEAHMLSPEAFNALLKTLEEPPEYCLFILATTELHKVPLTIRSRCQAIHFEKGSAGSIAQKLDQVIKKERLKVEAGVSNLIAEQAQGGFRDAETLLESLTTRYANLTLDLARAALGGMEETFAKELHEAIFQGHFQSLEAIDQKLASTINHEQLIIQLVNLTRTAIREVVKKADFASLSILNYGLEQLLEAFILLKSSPLPELPLEIACLNITQKVIGANLPLAAKTSPIPSKPAIPSVSMAPKITLTPTIALKVEPILSPSVPVIEIRESQCPDIRKAWRIMAVQLAQHNIVLSQSIKDTVIHTVEDNLIKVKVQYQFHADKMNEKKNLVIIKDIMKELTGQDFQIEFIVGKNIPKNPISISLTEGAPNPPDLVKEMSAVFSLNNS